MIFGDGDATLDLLCKRSMEGSFQSHHEALVVGRMMKGGSLATFNHYQTLCGKSISVEVSLLRRIF